MDENFAMLSSTENVGSGIFSNNLAENQCFLKYNKIFSFSYKKLWTETFVQFTIKIDKIKSFFITENEHLAFHDSEENNFIIVKN